jgi:hypothetical protein
VYGKASLDVKCRYTFAQIVAEFDVRGRFGY